MAAAAWRSGSVSRTRACARSQTTRTASAQWSAVSAKPLATAIIIHTTAGRCGCSAASSMHMTATRRSASAGAAARSACASRAASRASRRRTHFCTEPGRRLHNAEGAPGCRRAARQGWCSRAGAIPAGAGCDAQRGCLAAPCRSCCVMHLRWLWNQGRVATALRHVMHSSDDSARRSGLCNESAQHVKPCSNSTTRALGYHSMVHRHEAACSERTGRRSAAWVLRRECRRASEPHL